MSDTLRPLKVTTVVSADGSEWRPATFADFLEECSHATTGFNEVCFYRGHRQTDWLIDSTFARSLKLRRGLSAGQRYSDEELDSASFQHGLAGEWLRKFKSIYISPELRQHESQGIDLYYEHHRHHQQNPKNPRLADSTPCGTNLIDFTWNWKVGLFFANFKRANEAEGALFIVRQSTLGKALFREENSVQFVMQKLEQWLTDKPGQVYGHLPLLIHPQKQIDNSLDLKIKRQEALYIMQTDFRVDCGLSWDLRQRQIGDQIFIKLVLPANTQAEVQEYLAEQGVTKDFLLPDSTFD